MASNDRVVWSEGLFLRPQHFQQQDRFTISLITASLQGLQCYRWGFQALEIDQELLKVGKFSLKKCLGILPDGFAFNVNDHELVIDLPEGTQDVTLYLCLPISRANTCEFSEDSSDSHIRYSVANQLVNDNAAQANDTVEIATGSPRFQILPDSEPLDAYHSLAVAKVIQVGADRNVLLDADYIAPTLDCNAQPILHGYINEIEGMLHQRAESLAGRVSGAGRSSTEISDFLLLQAINRIEPQIRHLVSLPDLHPEPLFQTLIQVAGELATFTTKERRPARFETYVHDNLRATFDQVMKSLRESLSAVLESAATQIDISAPNQYGIRTASIGNKDMLKKAMFVLAVKADVPDDALRQSLPGQLKMGAVDKIAQLINKSLPGVAISPMPAAPRQIPFHAGTTYFQVNTASPPWQDIEKSGNIAFHVAGQYPGLDISFWSVRQ
ncbi:type VI secretion system baseplate subunit TssK [Alteromonadaceae bacterium BrNp21-10]|nr:type VI secretion system baseplate subunit TssK [Alteromonadaceae bacterium BrNp21-10]